MYAVLCKHCYQCDHEHCQQHASVCHHAMHINMSTLTTPLPCSHMARALPFQWHVVQGQPIGPAAAITPVPYAMFCYYDAGREPIHT